MHRLYRKNDNVICNHLEFIVLWGRSAHRLHIFFVKTPVISCDIQKKCIFAPELVRWCFDSSTSSEVESSATIRDILNNKKRYCFLADENLGNSLKNK